MLSQYFKQDQSRVYQFFLAVLAGLVLGIATVFATPIVVFGALITIFLVVLILKKPEFAVLGIIFFTATLFDSTANLGIFLGFGHIYLTDILLFTGLILVFVRTIMEPRFNIVHTPLDAPIILFVAMAFLSTFIAIMQKSLVLQQSLHEMRIVANYLVFFIITNLVRDEKQMRRLLGGLIILAVIVVIVMVIQYILGAALPILPGLGSSSRVEVLYTEGRSYASVTRIIPPGYSTVFVVFVTLSVVLLFDDFRAKNELLLIPLALTGLGLVFTFKRHLWFSAIMAFLLILYLGRKKELQRLIRGGAVIFLAAIIGVIFLVNFTGKAGPDLVNSSLDRLLSFVQPETYTDPNSSLRWRDFEYQYAIPQIISHPMLGLGLGSKYRPFVYPKDWAEFDGRGWIHNGHLWVIVKAGLLTYIPMLFFLVLFLYRGFKYWRLIPASWSRVYYLGFTIATLGMVIGSIIEPMIISWQWSVLIGTMMGCNEVILRSVSLGTQNHS